MGRFFIGGGPSNTLRRIARTRCPSGERCNGVSRVVGEDVSRAAILGAQPLGQEDRHRSAIWIIIERRGCRSPTTIREPDEPAGRHPAPKICLVRNGWIVGVVEMISHSPDRSPSLDHAPVGLADSSRIIVSSGAQSNEISPSDSAWSRVLSRLKWMQPDGMTRISRNTESVSHSKSTPPWLVGMMVGAGVFAVMLVRRMRSAI